MPEGTGEISVRSAAFRLLEEVRAHLDYANDVDMEQAADALEEALNRPHVSAETHSPNNE